MKRLLAYLFIVLGLGLTFSVSANASLKQIYNLNVNFCKSSIINLKMTIGTVVATLESCDKFKGIGIGSYTKSNVFEYKKYNNEARKTWRGKNYNTKFCLRKDDSKRSKSLAAHEIVLIFKRWSASRLREIDPADCESSVGKSGPHRHGRAGAVPRPRRRPDAGARGRPRGCASRGRAGVRGRERSESCRPWRARWSGRPLATPRRESAMEGGRNYRTPFGRPAEKISRVHTS